MPGGISIIAFDDRIASKNNGHADAGLFPVGELKLTRCTPNVRA